MISKKRLVSSVRRTILFFAIVHIAILIIYAISNAKVEVLNIFNILNLNFFVGNIGYGMLSQVISILLVAGVFGIVFFFFSE